jgi:hypothetical protein
MRSRQFQHLRPIRFARAVHHHPRQADLAARGQQLRLTPGKAVVLQMIVRVVKPGHKLAAIRPSATPYRPAGGVAFPVGAGLR